jgi:hypothetical protein
MYEINLMDSKGKYFAVVLSIHLLLSCCALSGTISLTADTTLPDPNDEVTVWVHTDEPLLFMSLGVYVNGDATITSAMSEADCNDFGWENDWGSDPIIDDPNGWVCLNGLCWAADANDVVGYFKFRYNSGQVYVYIDQEHSLGGNWGSNFTFSDESVVFGEIELPPLREPNEPTAVLLQSPAGSSGPSRGESESFAGWSQQMEMLEMLDSGPIVYVIDSDITENQVWDANDIYYIVGDPNNSYIVDVNSLLVIEPGTTVIMGYQSGLHVSDGGTLLAKGTPDKPIIFTPDWVFFDYPDYVGYYWQVYSSYGPYYHSIYIEDTASSLTTIRYCMIEGAVGGIITDNIRLDNAIENNYLFGNAWGVYEFGPKLTDVTNNLCFYQDQAAIEIELCPEPNGLADLNHEAKIEQNTCDGSGYTYCGITIHGVADPNTSGVPLIHLTNNIVTSNYHYGLNLVDGAMYASVISTGYFDNWADKNWEFNEYNPVITETNPYYPYILDYPWQHHYLVGDADFVNAGLQYIERSKLIGTKTNADNVPDKDIVDLGFHHSMWDYVGGEGIAGTDIDDLIEISDYWLEYSPFEPNSPGYIDPNLYIYDPNHPELWIDPNTVTYGGDWNNDNHVDLLDFAEMAKLWNAAPSVPPLQPVIEGSPNDGQIGLTVSGCNDDTVLVYAFVNGKYVGQVYALGTDTKIGVDCSESGNLPQEVKFVAIDRNGHFAFSEPTEITSTSPLSYCILPSAYEPNEPIPFTAFNTGAGNATIEVYGNGEQLLWSQNFSGNTITGSIPADYTSDDQIIDYITFTSASGGSVTKTTFPKVKPGDIDVDVQALMIMPATDLFDLDPYVRLKVLQTFIDRGIKFKRFEGTEATWENVARYGQWGFVKYIYLLTHGKYEYKYHPGGDPNTPEEQIYRTYCSLSGGVVLSCKASEYTTPPGWCKPFPDPIERAVPTWASMQFDRIQFFYNDACYGGRLKINGAGQLVEGQPGQMGVVYDGPHSDMSLALGLQDTYEARCYHGWYDKGWVGWAVTSNEHSSYQEWGKDVWQKLREGHNLYDALQYAISETEWFGPTAAVNNYRLKGQGLLTDIRIRH